MKIMEKAIYMVLKPFQIIGVFLLKSETTKDLFRIIVFVTILVLLGVFYCLIAEI